MRLTNVSYLAACSRHCAHTAFVAEPATQPSEPQPVEPEAARLGIGGLRPRVSHSGGRLRSAPVASPMILCPWLMRCGIDSAPGRT